MSTSKQCHAELDAKRREFVARLPDLSDQARDAWMVEIDQLTKKLHETIRREASDAVLIAEARYVAKARSTCLAYRDLIDAARAAKRLGVTVEHAAGPDFPHLHEQGLTTAEAIEAGVLAWLNATASEVPTC